jgi:hypothetical protein
MDMEKNNKGVGATVRKIKMKVVDLKSKNKVNEGNIHEK